MTITYEKVASTTLGSAAASVSFTSISGIYTDLIMVVAGQTSSSGANVLLQFNSDTSTSYSTTILFGDGTNVGSARSTNATSINIGDFDGNSESNTIAHIQNYSNTTTYKSAIGRANRVLTSTVAKSGLWRSTAAITSITVLASAGETMKAGTIITFYGIKAE